MALTVHEDTTLKYWIQKIVGSSILEKIYPVGSIYMSMNPTNPSSFIGGKWEQLQNRVLLGAGDAYDVGATGGEATHTLTADELPSHKHSVGAHAHGLNSHTHTLSNHTHTTNIGHGHGFTQPKHYRRQVAASGDARYAFQGSSTSGEEATAHGGAVTDYSGSKTSGGPSTDSTGAASGNTANSSAFDSGAVGSGAAHNNMPPYLAVYMWQRVA